MGKKVVVTGKVAAPVRIGEEVALDILRSGMRGEGVARYDDFAVFVEGALPGEKVAARITEVKERFARAKLLQIKTSSSSRVTPLCPAFGVCGGCQVQHLDYAGQLLWKRQLVVDAMVRIGHFDLGQMESLVEPVRGMAEPWRYRNKVSLLAAPKGAGFVAGFVEEGTHEPVTQTECLLRPVLHDDLLRMILAVLEQYQVTAFADATGTGEIRQIQVRSTKSGAAMVVLITAVLLARGKDIAKALASAPLEQGKVVSVVEEVIAVSRNRRGVSTPKERVLWGQPELRETLLGLDFLVSAQSFLQVNPEQTEALYQLALEMAQLTGQETVLDLYAGIGTLTLAAARHAGQVYGVESVPAAVENAFRNRELNGMHNADFYLGKAEDVLPELVQQQGLAADVILLDPPRAGCKPEVIAAMAATQARRIVYVSCNPATLARDLALLGQRGYRVERVAPVDMFPQTAHVETVAMLVKTSIPAK